MRIIPEQMLTILICPVCKTKDFTTYNSNELVCSCCGQRFPVVDGCLDMNWQTGDDLCHRVIRANIELHDSYAEFYESPTLNQVFAGESFRHLETLMAELAGRNGKKRLLDVGCGTGFVLKAAETHFAERYGIDISKGMLKLSARFNAYLICASAYSIPFMDEAFDVITANATLHHIYDFQTFFSEIYRILKPGGAVLINHDPNAAFRRYFGWQKRLRRIMMRKKRRETFHYSEEVVSMADYHQFQTAGINAREVKDLLLSIGFSNIEVFYTFPSTPDCFTRLLITMSRWIDSPALRYMVGFKIQK